MKTGWLVLGLVFASFVHSAHADPAPRSKVETHLVPYRLTDTLHILVRVKIDGKGPFNFIVDTGAPVVFVTKETAKKLGLEGDKKGWAVLDRFAVEGGIVQDKVKVRVETPFQLEGMNALGFAGAELHGIIGYTFLAKYRMEIDFKRDRMTWTPLAFNPPPPVPLGKGVAPAGLAAIGTMMKLLGAFVGRQPEAELTPRGFLGIELAEKDGAVTVASVLAGTPAAKAGLQAGDQITSVQGKAVRSTADVHRYTTRVTAGQEVRLTVLRGTAKQHVTITAGEGL